MKFCVRCHSSYILFSSIITGEIDVFVSCYQNEGCLKYLFTFNYVCLCVCLGEYVHT